MAMPLFVMMMTMVLKRHTFANSYAGAKTDLPWPCPSLCLLTTDDSCFFPLLASTWFVCVFVFFSLCRSLCSSNCLSVFLSFCLSVFTLFLSFCLSLSFYLSIFCMSVYLSVCLIAKSYLEIEWSLLTSDDESLQKLNSCHSLEVDISRRPLSLSPFLGNISTIILLRRNMSRNRTFLAYFLRI